MSRTTLTTPLRLAPGLTLALALALATPAAGQSSPYAGEAPRAIAALSEQEVADLLDGAGMGFARAAELNGVPGPRHALDMADALALHGSQRELLQDVFLRMQRQARRLGTEIVEAERELDALFEGGDIDPADVDERAVELGRLYGQLRAVHLKAHLETAAILSPEQTAHYASLRGYTSPVEHGAGSDPAHSGHSAHQ